MVKEAFAEKIFKYEEIIPYAQRLFFSPKNLKNLNFEFKPAVNLWNMMTEYFHQVESNLLEYFYAYFGEEYRKISYEEAERKISDFIKGRLKKLENSYFDCFYKNDSKIERIVNIIMYKLLYVDSPFVYSLLENCYSEKTLEDLNYAADHINKVVREYKLILKIAENQLMDAFIYLYSNFYLKD